MVSMDATIVNVALPAIRRDLGVETSGLQWVIDAYTMVVASLLMLAGLARGSARPPAHVPDRPGGVHGRVGAVQRRRRA